MRKPLPQATERIAYINQIMYREPAAALALAKALFEESVAQGDVATQVQTSVLISTTEDQLGERFDGGKLLLEALALCERHDLKVLAVQVLERLGRDRYTAGLYAESLAYWIRCIDDCRAQQHCGHSHVYALIGLGHICSAYNESDQAVLFHRAALQLLKLHPDPLIHAKAQISLGWDLYNSGNSDEAAQILRDTVALSREHRFGHYVSESLLHLGTIALKANQLAEAELYLEEALEELQETPSHWAEANVLGKLAEVRFLQGMPQMARDMVERAIRLAMQDGMRHIEARLNAQAAGYCAALNDADGIAFYGQQLDKLHETNTQSWHIPAINLTNIRQYLPKKS